MRPMNSSKNKLNSKKKIYFSSNAKCNLNLNEEFDQFSIQEKQKIWSKVRRMYINKTSLHFLNLKLPFVQLGNSNPSDTSPALGLG